MEKKKALITGITGQDGSYLTELLLQKGYEVHGLKRRASSFNTNRIDHLYQDPHVNDPSLILHYGDLSDSTNLIRVINNIVPDEIYNLGAQSHVSVSFESPEYTANCDALGTLRLLEAIRILKLESRTKFYQASTSELYGKTKVSPQSEETVFQPCSPYGVAKLYAYWIVKNYRDAYGIYACNGILFNHESPRRGETFVTRKITRGLARIHLGLERILYLGNLDAKRDWGHAKDYVEMQWLMLQQKVPEDFVIATGRQETIRSFIDLVSIELGWNIVQNESGIKWEGEGVETVGIRKDNGQEVIRIDLRYYRPCEVDSLLGDSKKAEIKLGWKPKIKLEDMIKEMVNKDLDESKKESLLKKSGFEVIPSIENPPSN